MVDRLGWLNFTLQNYDSLNMTNHIKISHPHLGYHFGKMGVFLGKKPMQNGKLHRFLQQNHHTFLSVSKKCLSLHAFSQIIKFE